MNARCSHYTGRIRCEADAEVWLVQDDGEDNPGGRMCLAHATACIEEFAEKLGERWTVRPLTEGERL